MNFCARVFLHWLGRRTRVCGRARTGARVYVRARTATRFRRSFGPLSTRGGPRRPRRPAPVWQRRGRHRFRSATATARLPPGRHDTKAVLAVQRFLRSDAQAAADDATRSRRDRPLRLFRYRFRSFTNIADRLVTTCGGTPSSRLFSKFNFVLRGIREITFPARRHPS